MKKRTLADFYKVLIKRARRKFGSEVDDFAQEACVRILEGKSQHQSVNQMIIDRARKVSGDKRARSHYQRANFEAPLNIDSLNLSIDPVESMQRKIDFERIMFSLKGMDKCLIQMHFVENMTCKEIGEYFGFTEAWASGRVIQIIRRLSKRFINK